VRSLLGRPSALSFSGDLALSVSTGGASTGGGAVSGDTVSTVNTEAVNASEKYCFSNDGFESHVFKNDDLKTDDGLITDRIFFENAEGFGFGKNNCSENYGFETEGGPAKNDGLREIGFEQDGDGFFGGGD
ncbi:unnamed protein product, partial [Laminaria digitata]